MRYRYRKVPPGRKLFPLTLRTMIRKVPQIVYNEKRR